VIIFGWTTALIFFYIQNVYNESNKGERWRTKRTLNIERRTSNIEWERLTSNVEHRMSKGKKNVEHRTVKDRKNVEDRTLNIEHRMRKINFERSTSKYEW
jgi:hypothetical protein